MKFKFILAVVTLLIIVSCQSNKSHFGEKINPVGAVSVEEMLISMSILPEYEAKITAEIKAVCQTKGCWMHLDKGDGTVMRVVFKDYGFFVPKDIAGKTATMEGFAYLDTTSVEMLRHYAEDANLSEEEILAITEPEIEVVFEARGVIVE